MGESYVDNFDVPIGAYDSAQIADLIGFHMLDTLGRIVNLKLVSLFWDDGIIFIPDSNGPKTSKIQKIVRAFKLKGLRIEIAPNLMIVDFLDVILNLDNGTIKPFSKRNSTHTYINTDINHPRSIMKQIPNAVNQRINILFSYEKHWGEQKYMWWIPQKQQIPT